MHFRLVAQALIRMGQRLSKAVFAGRLRARIRRRKSKRLGVVHNPVFPVSQTCVNAKMAGRQNPIIIDDDIDDDIDSQDGLQDVMEIADHPLEYLQDYEDIGDFENLVDHPEHFEASLAAQNTCKDHVKSVFPDICPTYLDQIVAENKYDSDFTIGAILDRQEKGEKYPVRSRDLKRKRAEDDNSDVEDGPDDEDEEARKAENAVITATRKKLEQVDYRVTTVKKSCYTDMAKNFLASEYVEIYFFPKVPIPVIKNLLRANGGSIFETYTKMDEAIRNWDNARPPWTEKRRASRTIVSFLPVRIENLDMSEYNDDQKAAIDELRAARDLKTIKDAEVARKAEEEKNFAHAKSIGEVVECGCCFDEFPLNRMIHCDGEDVHWFCRNCMRSQVETNIGLSKYEISCMSMDGCEAGFSIDQKKRFLNKKLRVALERLEQEAVLRMAGIENLETCPFCPYAAEYPPVEIDKEFTCVNPGCEKVSCRLCRKETHIPKTCAEAAVDHGLDARHVLEEAMSAALIRRCNKCQNPYLKLNGCNKISCTKCHTLQCYVCRQTITDYRHFDDSSRGGKNGQCPLFDKTEERHQQEVQQAEETARQKMLKDNTNITEDALKINISEQVLRDDQKRRKGNLAQGAPGIPADILDNMNNRIDRLHRLARERHAAHPFINPPAQPAAVAGGPQVVGQDVLPRMAAQLGNVDGGDPPLIPPMPPIQLPEQFRALYREEFQRRLVALRAGVPPPVQPLHDIAPVGRLVPPGAPPVPQPGAPQLPALAPEYQPIHQPVPQVLQQRMFNGLPQEPPAEYPALYRPMNEYQNIRNPNGFNFRRFG
ncbi:uncharacterized protein F4817DRAFT_314665 [Daldinia loculata]|uniref:uncharacterized protein n=1 Tax=Daldinia loculata TaxID=103429 RepID=UPI0020C29441|nr:uncharacterized protein F4817DRAFT_314665 [Daldinia loculata]KAI1648706.1 hypothetical protein F4817DRAFT_314665 [Daldinia loculata]